MVEPIYSGKLHSLREPAGPRQTRSSLKAEAEVVRLGVQQREVVEIAQFSSRLAVKVAPSTRSRASADN